MGMVRMWKMEWSHGQLLTALLRYFQSTRQVCADGPRGSKSFHSTYSTKINAVYIRNANQHWGRIIKDRGFLQNWIFLQKKHEVLKFAFTFVVRLHHCLLTALSNFYNSQFYIFFPLLMNWILSCLRELLCHPSKLSKMIQFAFPTCYLPCYTFEKVKSGAFCTRNLTNTVSPIFFYAFLR